MEQSQLISKWWVQNVIIIFVNIGPDLDKKIPN